MIPGTTAFVGLSVLGGWMNRQADNARFSFQVIDYGGAASPTVTITIRVYHKNADETGDGTLITSPTITFTAGTDANGAVKVDTWSGLKELVRFEYVVTGTQGHWVHFQHLAPVWFNTPNV